MFATRLCAFLLLLACLLWATPAALAENDGLEELDDATQQKVSAEGLSDLNKVVDLLDTALEKGLDADNTDFAEQLLVATLIQRAQALSTAILQKELPNPRQDPRWVQIRQFALTDLQRAVALDETQWDAHFLIGRLQVLPLGDPNAARRALTKVVRAEEVPARELSQAYALRGAVQRDPESRLKDFDRAIELQPENADYLRLRAQHHSVAEDFDSALRDVDRLLELKSEDAAAHQLRGMILLGKEQFEEALQSFNTASQLAPDALMPYQHRGELYRRQGDLQKAAEQLTKALEISPDDLATLLIRAAVHHQAGDADAALADIDRLLEKHPQLLRAHQMKADILAGNDQLAAAIKHLEETLQKSPAQPAIQYQLATFYLINQQAQRSADAFTELLANDPDNLAALRGRGDAYLNIGKHTEAIADFEHALAEASDDEGLLNNLAWVLATSPFDEHRDGPRALELATKACELSAYQTPHILSTLAAAYAETGDFDQAIKWSKKAVELGADDPNVEQLAHELSNYEKQQPWRELQSNQDDAASAEPEPESSTGDQSFAPPSAAPAPARTADF